VINVFSILGVYSET